jgi:hypothetical protein
VDEIDHTCGPGNESPARLAHEARDGVPTLADALDDYDDAAEYGSDVPLVVGGVDLGLVLASLVGGSLLALLVGGVLVFVATLL